MIFNREELVQYLKENVSENEWFNVFVSAIELNNVKGSSRLKKRILPTQVKARIYGMSLFLKTDYDYYINVPKNSLYALDYENAVIAYNQCCENAINLVDKNLKIVIENHEKLKANIKKQML